MLALESRTQKGFGTVFLASEELFGVILSGCPTLCFNGRDSLWEPMRLVP